MELDPLLLVFCYNLTRNIHLARSNLRNTGFIGRWATTDIVKCLVYLSSLTNHYLYSINLQIVGNWRECKQDPFPSVLHKPNPLSYWLNYHSIPSASFQSILEATIHLPYKSPAQPQIRCPLQSQRLWGLLMKVLYGNLSITHFIKSNSIPELQQKKKRFWEEFESYCWVCPTFLQ